MFAPMMAKASATAAASPARKAAQPGTPPPARRLASTHKPAPRLQWSIGNRVTPASSQKGAHMQAGEPSRDPHAHEAEPTLTPERSLAWDFGKLPLSPTEPSSAPDASAPLLGNIQRKLAIGSVDDPLEHEADRVADLVMRVPDPDIAVTSAPRQVSRKCAECEEEDKQKLQMKPAAASQSQTVSAPPIVHDVLRSPGQPLEKAARASLEPRFGHDFSQLRIHADAKAAEFCAGGCSPGIHGRRRHRVRRGPVHARNGKRPQIASPRIGAHDLTRSRPRAGPIFSSAASARR